MDKILSFELNNSDQGFLVGLYFEYIEESGFLYEQRLSLFDDPEISWPDIKEWEDRIEAHLDGLFLGGDLALAVCQKQALELEYDQLYPIVRVYYRQRRFDLFEELLEELDSDEEDQVKAVTDALKDENPLDWFDKISLFLEEDEDLYLKIAVPLVGYFRFDQAKRLKELLGTVENQELKSQIILALGELKEFKNIDFIENKDFNFFLASLRSKSISLNSPLEQKALIPLALAGELRERDFIRKTADDNLSKEAILALGIFGQFEDFGFLLENLKSDKFKTETAMALNLITGANLYKDIFIPDQIEEDELFEDELEKFKAGTLYKEGEWPGTTQNLLSEDFKDWDDWLKENKHKFNPAKRYRLGEPHSPGSLFKTIEDFRTLPFLRKLAADELLIRYQIDLPFDPKVLVEKQKEVISSYFLLSLLPHKKIFQKKLNIN